MGVVYQGTGNMEQGTNGKELKFSYGFLSDTGNQRTVLIHFKLFFSKFQDDFEHLQAFVPWHRYILHRVYRYFHR